MTTEQQKMVDSKLYTRQPAGEPPVRSSEWLDDLVKQWDDAEKSWRKAAHGKGATYEDGLAEGFHRCSVMLSNRIFQGPTNRSQGWWCEQCQTHVSGRDVTYDETHDRRAGGCGARVV